MKLRIFLTLIWTLLWWFLTEYLFMPALSLHASPGIYFNITIYTAILGLIWMRGRYESEKPSVSPFLFGVAIISFLLMMLIGVFNGRMFRAPDYQAMIGEIEETEFTSNIQPVSANQMLIVDEEMANRIGEKELGSDPGLGSRAKLGKFHLQAVAGQLYWIAPIEHSGFWRWNKFKNEGTPGYVRVSATNQEDYSLVRKVSDQNLNIKYQTGAFFRQDLGRHIYTSGYRSELYMEYIFEVDDSWNPFWTVTVYSSEIGFGGSNAHGVLTIDPKSGEIKQYSIEDAPSWIDRIQPEMFVHNQVDDWGHYVHGYWNWSHTDVKRSTDESALVLGSDGRSYFYFGLTSSGNDNSTVGFVMVDTRNKKAHWFKQAGATEAAARRSAEGKVQEKEYVGSDGVTYNINGYATYEYLLKDKGGLMKLIALVNVHDHTIVGIGENRHEAIQDYRSQITNRGNAISITASDMDKIEIRSKVIRFAAEIVRGNTSYYLTLESLPTTLFTAGTTISRELPLTKGGDLVEITYLNVDNGEISFIEFDNLDINLQQDSLQLSSVAKVDSVREEDRMGKVEGVVNQQWSKMTPEEKQKILNKN